jgi:hypothetical protein
MHRMAAPEPTIGMVGPMSNYAASPQPVGGVSYDDLEAMHRFTEGFRAEHRVQRLAVVKLTSFCLLIKRRVREAAPAGAGVARPGKRPDPPRKMNRRGSLRSARATGSRHRVSDIGMAIDP